MISGAGLLALALALDALLGEPKWVWDRVPHPAVLMGRLIARCDAVFNQGSARRAKGALVVLTLVLGSIALGKGIAHLPLGAVWQVVIVTVLLAQRSLVDHVAAVAEALRRGLSEGRSAVSMIVGRDVSELDKPAVARAAIESAAENMSDGVVAPAFWFLIGGVPGILVYKIVNTADSMIGHKTPRHAEFGWAAARLDDVLNYIPARLTAAAISMGNRHTWRVAWQDGPKHRSVNAGWPEAAMAAELGLALSGPRSYGGKETSDPVLNAAGTRGAMPGDIDASIAVLWRVWTVLLAVTVALWII